MKAKLKERRSEYDEGKKKDEEEERGRGVFIGSRTSE
jgi:hypothetical protein